MIFIFLALTIVIALISGGWKAADRDEKLFVVKTLAKGAFFASIATGILFVIVTLF